MSSHHSAALIVSLAGALLALILLGGASIVAWRRLARTYPDRQFPVDASFRAISGQVGGTFGTLERCLRVDVGDAGLRISTRLPLQWLLPPFMFLWSEITGCTLARYYFSPEAARLELAKWPQPIYLWPRLWRDDNLPKLLQERWHEHAPKVA